MCHAVPSCAKLCQSVSGCAKLCQAVSMCVRLCQAMPSCARLCQVVLSCAKLCQAVSNACSQCTRTLHLALCNALYTCTVHLARTGAQSKAHCVHTALRALQCVGGPRVRSCPYQSVCPLGCAEGLSGRPPRLRTSTCSDSSGILLPPFYLHFTSGLPPFYLHFTHILPPVYPNFTTGLPTFYNHFTPSWLQFRPSWPRQPEWLIPNIKPSCSGWLSSGR